MSITLRAATREDAATIAGFNSAMALETEARTLDRETIAQGVLALLTDERKGRYWVAESGDTLAGQLMLTYEWSDWRNGVIWWIQSVYVHPDFRRQGVFRQLFEHVKRLAEADPAACGIRLYVEKDNRRAQATYAALGMNSDKYLVMEAVP
ncbi:MAG: GNAT family N-acetyltransferase [Pseudomonadota bacterium]